LQALAEWAALADRFGSRHHASAPGGSLPFAASAVAAAAEEGLALLSRQAQELSDPLLLQELDLQPADSSSQEPPALSLDELAAAVRRDHPALFAATPSSSDTTDSSNSSSRSEPSSSDPSSSSSTALRVEQARALADSLYRRQRFKFEPFEWVYEGLDPLLLPPRLQRRKLAPLTLALVAAGVGRRLGLPLLPVPAEPEGEIVATVVEGPGGGPAGAQGLPMEQLRPDVAQRYAGRSQGLAPASGPWVLLLDSGSGSGSSGDWGPAEAGGGQQWQHVMDASSGELLEAAAAQLKHPDLQLVGNAAAYLLSGGALRMGFSTQQACACHAIAAHLLAPLSCSCSCRQQTGSCWARWWPGSTWYAPSSRWAWQSGAGRRGGEA
jgi:hypothetical protein